MLTQEGHKTQYAPMTVGHIYRVHALIPELQTVHNEMRCLSMSHNPSSCVGWDMPIENENGWIRADVHPPNEAAITKYIDRLAFTSPVSQGLTDVMHFNRQTVHPAKLKDITSLSDKVFRFLCDKLIHYDGAYGPFSKSELWERVSRDCDRSSLMSGVTAANVPPWRKTIKRGFVAKRCKHRTS